MTSNILKKEYKINNIIVASTGPGKQLILRLF